MAAPTDYFCDPSIAADSGAGTIGDPWGDLQFALNSITRDATDGDRINIKAGTAEVVSAELDLTSYGTPADTAPLIFQGYTSAQGDGGKGVLDGNGGTHAFWNKATVEGVYFVDLKFQNVGAATAAINIDRFCGVFDCEFEDIAATNVIIGQIGNAHTVLVSRCHFHDLSNTVLKDVRSYGNYFKNDGTKDIGTCLYNCFSWRDIASLDGSSNFFDADGTNLVVCQQANVLSSSGTGIGINFDFGRFGLLTSCLVEGFSGAGGVGIKVADSGRMASLFSNNGAFNNTTNYSIGADVIIAEDNEELASTPFAKSGADTFANRFTYFAPVDTGNVLGGAYVG